MKTNIIRKLTCRSQWERVGNGFTFTLFQVYVARDRGAYFFALAVTVANFTVELLQYAVPADLETIKR